MRQLSWMTEPISLPMKEPILCGLLTFQIMGHQRFLVNLKSLDGRNISVFTIIGSLPLDMTTVTENAGSP